MKQIIQSVALALLLVSSVCEAKSVLKVKFDTGGGSRVPVQTIVPGNAVEAPAHPVKDGMAFVGWYSDKEADSYMWDFLNDRPSTSMTLYAKWVKLDSKHLLLNAYATPEELENPYIAATLQTLGDYDSAARSLSLPDGTTVYVAPGVYWTDDTYRKGFPFDDSGFVLPRPNVGLNILGHGLSFIGLTSDAEDVRICGNRGEGGAAGLGATGSWYSLGVSSDFRGENLTIANYAQEDLVYKRDPSQNISKRIDSKNHAEVLQTAERGVDRMYFRNVRFVGYLNMMAGFAPKRAYFKDCFIQCTDDSVFGGTMNVYENCTFHFVDNHPTWGGANADGINALLGCHIYGMPQMTHPMLSFAKNASGRDGASASGIYAVIDCDFTGRIQSVEWENIVHDYSRYAVHGNTIGDDRKPLTISSHTPKLSVEYDGAALEAFKVGDKYNIYNLLKGDDGWDPAGQYSEAWKPYSNLPYRFLLGASGYELNSAGVSDDNKVVLTPAPVPASSVDLSKVKWNYDESLFDAELDASSGVLTLSAKPNHSGKVTVAPVDCVLPNGIAAGVTLKILPVPVASPVLGNPSIAIHDGLAILNYSLDNSSFRDVSRIEWYREKGPDTTDGAHIGTMMNDAEGLFVDDPYKHYRLNRYDTGYYLRAVITPKYEFSPASESSITVYSPRPIENSDISDQRIATDFKNLFIAVEDPATTKGRWFFENCSGGVPWTWGIGTNGADGLWGLENSGRGMAGARMVFAQDAEYGDMSFSLSYSPGKVEGQGFGGSGCYMDIYVKYDPATRSGWGVRIERVPATTNGTKWTLCRFDDENVERLTEGILTAAFMPQSKITVYVEGNTLGVKASTQSSKTPLQIKENLPESLDLKWSDGTGVLSANRQGSVGIRINNSGAASYRVNAMSNNCVMLHGVEISCNR